MWAAKKRKQNQRNNATKSRRKPDNFTPIYNYDQTPIQFEIPLPSPFVKIAIELAARYYIFPLPFLKDYSAEIEDLVSEVDVYNTTIDNKIVQTLAKISLYYATLEDDIFILGQNAPVFYHIIEDKIRNEILKLPSYLVQTELLRIDIDALEQHRIEKESIFQTIEKIPLFAATVEDMIRVTILKIPVTQKNIEGIIRNSISTIPQTKVEPRQNAITNLYFVVKRYRADPEQIRCIFEKKIG